MSGIRLFVGLGNPGLAYAEHRHNAGFWWIDAVAAQQQSCLKPEAKFLGTFSSGSTWHLFKPDTFMNRSGQAVATVSQFYKISTEEILVIHDELDLPPGTVRLKKGGGHGGHNGLKSIIAWLGSVNFWRLRLGIGHPGDKNRVADYVLHRPDMDDLCAINDAVHNSQSLFPLFIQGEFAALMRQLHTDRKQSLP